MKCRFWKSERLQCISGRTADLGQLRSLIRDRFPEDIRAELARSENGGRLPTMERNLMAANARFREAPLSPLHPINLGC